MRKKKEEKEIVKRMIVECHEDVFLMAIKRESQGKSKAKRSLKKKKNDEADDWVKENEEDYKNERWRKSEYDKKGEDILKKFMRKKKKRWRKKWKNNKEGNDKKKLRR